MISRMILLAGILFLLVFLAEGVLALFTGYLNERWDGACFTKVYSERTGQPVHLGMYAVKEKG